jgi:c-di-GMP phosphodiesterase
MSTDTFIGRQPILNLQNQIVGYELFFRASADATSAAVQNSQEASTKVLANLLMDMGTNWVLGDKLAFVNVDADVLQSDWLDVVPPDRVVLELGRDVRATADVEEKLQRLYGRGFAICLDDFDLKAPSAPLLAWASYVKLDTMRLDEQALQQTIAGIDSRAKKIVAMRVESKDTFQTAARLGIKHFQGYYFARPVTLGAKAANPSVITIMELLRLTRENADVRTLEDVVKRDPTLLFKMLRYINSPAVGLRSEITSFRQALGLLGYDKLYRWLTLVMATAGTSPAAAALAKTAITRGFLAESLAESAFSRDCADQLFMVGAFSLLDVMFDTPKEAMFEKISLPLAVKEAILQRKGAYAPVLDLIELCEQQEIDKLAAKALEIDLSPAAMNQAHLTALAKVEQLGI